jgi:hypothetical protein
MCTACNSGFKSVHCDVGNDKNRRSSSSVRAVVVATIPQTSMQLLYTRCVLAVASLFTDSCSRNRSRRTVFHLRTSRALHRQECRSTSDSAPVLSSDGHIQSPANDLSILWPGVLRAALSNSISTSISCIDHHPGRWTSADTWRCSLISHLI